MNVKVSSIYKTTMTHSREVPDQQKVDKKIKKEDHVFSEILKAYMK